MMSPVATRPDPRPGDHLGLCGRALSEAEEAVEHRAFEEATELLRRARLELRWAHLALAMELDKSEQIEQRLLATRAASRGATATSAIP